jgi:AraC-like DNA-binding protein
MIETLIRFFPDSRIIGTVRNPLKAVPSHISSMMKGAAIFDNDTSGHGFREQMIGVQRYAYTHLIEILPDLPEDRQMILSMEDLKEKLGLSVKKIYDRFGHEMSPLFKAFIDHQEQRQKLYKSGHTYDISGCGLTDTMIYERFSDVFEKFAYERPSGTRKPDYKSSPIDEAI